jgi:hypothetical protein
MVSLYLDGYQPYTTTVYVSPGQEAEVHAVLQPEPAPAATTTAGTLATAAPHPATTTKAPDILQGIIASIRNLIYGVVPTNMASRSGAGSTVTSDTGGVNTITTMPTGISGGTTPANGKIVAAYFFILDSAYNASMSVKATIPWRKVNRVYIAFATVHDGVLTDFPSGSSPEESSAREENAGKIRNIVALVRHDNPDAEIFISSNFGDEKMDNKYLQAAQDSQKFADSVVAYMKKYCLDGYDMDWESYQINDDAPS